MNSCYLDIDGYITSNFDSRQSLKLPLSYSDSELQAVFQVLKNHYIEIIIQISVDASLQIWNDSKQLSITTPNLFSLSLAIALSNPGDGANKCRCLHKVDLPVVSAIQDASITLQGTLIDTNEALKRISVNLDEDLQVCPGSVTLNDGLNLELTKPYDDISQYFKNNEFPKLNLNVSPQGQLDAASTKMGYFFSVLLNESAFIGQNLEYKLQYNAYSWLNLNDLFLSGTPPEQIWPPQSLRFWERKYDLGLIVANEYKYIAVPLTLTVSISILYALKILGEIVTVIGFYIYFPKILNVFCKKRYRYPKNLLIKVGEEITSEYILPIAFISVELTASKFIIKKLENSIAAEVKESIAPKPDLLGYLLDSDGHNIDEDKLIRTIHKVTSSLASEKQIEFKQYIEASPLKKKLIEQLILNELVNRLIKRKQERETLLMFGRIKSKWLELVQKGELAPWQLCINQAKLEKELEMNGINISKLDEHELKIKKSDLLPSVGPTRNSKMELSNSLDDNIIKTKMKPLDVELLRESRPDQLKHSKNMKINLNLLSRALVGYAFEQQHLYIRSSRINVDVMEKIESHFMPLRIIKEFLKLDLKNIFQHSRSSKGYGIDYDTEDDCLGIFGTPNMNFKGKIIVMQIMTRRGRILREIWLYNDLCISKKVGLSTIDNCIETHELLL